MWNNEESKMLRMAERIATALESMVELQRKTLETSRAHLERCETMDEWTRLFYDAHFARDGYVVEYNSRMELVPEEMTASEFRLELERIDRFETLKKSFYDEKWEREKAAKRAAASKGDE